MQFQQQMMGFPAIRGKEFDAIPQSGSSDSGFDAIPVSQIYDQSFGGYIILGGSSVGSEMGTTRRTIDGISLYKQDRAGSGSVSMVNQYIKLAHCTDTIFPSGTLDPTGGSASAVSLSNILTLTDETTVFSGSITFTGSTGEWTDKIQFDTPFKYNGRDNLAVLWINADNSYVSNRYEWGVVTATARMLHQESDSTSVENMTSFRSNEIPQTKFYY